MRSTSPTRSRPDLMRAASNPYRAIDMCGAAAGRTLGSRTRGCGEPGSGVLPAAWGPVPASHPRPRPRVGSGAGAPPAELPSGRGRGAASRARDPVPVTAVAVEEVHARSFHHSVCWWRAGSRDDGLRRVPGPAGSRSPSCAAKPAERGVPPDRPAPRTGSWPNTGRACLRTIVTPIGTLCLPLRRTFEGMAGSGTHEEAGDRPDDLP